LRLHPDEVLERVRGRQLGAAQQQLPGEQGAVERTGGQNLGHVAPRLEWPLVSCRFGGVPEYRRYTAPMPTPACLAPAEIGASGSARNTARLDPRMRWSVHDASARRPLSGA